MGRRFPKADARPPADEVKAGPFVPLDCGGNPDVWRKVQHPQDEADPTPARLRDGVVASPQYLKRAGMPQTPQELTNHNCINIRLPTYGTLFVWELEKDGHEVKVRVDGQFVVNTMDLRLNAALHGLGLAYMPQDQIQPHVASGQLVQVLDGWSPTFSGYHLYYPHRRHPSPAFRSCLRLCVGGHD